MELIGKIFEINGQHKKVSNTDDTFAYFEDGARIKKDALITKYEEVMDPASFFNNTASIQNLAQEVKSLDTSKIIKEESTVVSNSQELNITKNENIQNHQPVKPLNSGNDFFSKIKRNTTVTINFSIEEKFPSLDFVRMMNDNYETSIIDHFAQEIVEKLTFDPDSLLESVKKRLNEIVYGDEKTDKKSKSSKKPQQKT